MTDPAAALRAELGDDAVDECAPVPVDGAKLALRLRPACGDALSAALAALSRHGLRAVVRGGGTKLALGNPPTDPHVLLSTEALAGVDAFEPGEGVCHVRAGTTLAELRRVVSGEGGWELPLDAPFDCATVGGVLSAAAVGPRAQGFGRPRDVVLGLEVALASGERTRCGGRVVKNVTGYDLAKLYVGSLGTLGVIEGAWLRLRPRPEEVVALTAPAADTKSGCEGALLASRLATARVAALAARGDALRILVELAGDAEAVESDAEALRAETGAGEGVGDAVDELRRQQGALGAEGGLRFRVSALPTGLVPAATRLRHAGAALVAYPGPGLLFADLTSPDAEGAWPAAFAAAAEAARVGGGTWLCESAPAAAKRGRDVFGEAPELLPLHRALKQRFDPQGVLNPGRFAGHL